MIRVIVCGAAGRMGQAVIDLAREQTDIDIIAGVERGDHAQVGKHVHDIPVVDDIRSVIDRADCVVDFTHREVTFRILDSIDDHPVAFVSGTTGFSEDDHETMRAYAGKRPLLWAPNMSPGINHLYYLTEQSAVLLPDYDIEIVETHHRHKKDAPSGTARRIADLVCRARKTPMTVTHGREGQVGQRDPNTVGVHAVRGGDVVGEHRVFFLGDGEFIELRHHATSRTCFAAGALRAARWLQGKPAGLYTMQDLFRM
jgi:4-hydroxy-tetrahydrodipicolinate reductase